MTTFEQIRAAQEERARLVDEQRSEYEKATKENRLSEPEWIEARDRRRTRISELSQSIQDLTELLETERSMSDGEGLEDPAGEPENRTQTEREQERADQEWEERILEGVRPELREHFQTAFREAPEATREYRRAFSSALRSGVGELEGEERRTMQSAIATSGGYLMAPPQFLARLIQAVDDAVVLRQWGTVYSVTSGDSLGAPALDSDLSDFEWTTELKTGSDDDLSFGGRELEPQPIAKRVKISNKLLRVSAIDPEALVRRRLAYKAAGTMEKAGMTGDGVKKPLGVFTASDDGISTSRDFVGDNATDAPKFGGLKEAKWSLKGQYHRNARWLAHRDFYKEVDTITDSNGQFVWQESTQVGAPDRLLGFPVHMSEFAPNTFTTGKYVAILGDFSFMWWADLLAFMVQRLVELYAEKNAVGFIGRMESDGMPVLEEAFSRVKLG